VYVTDVRFSADGRRLLTTDWGSQRRPQVWDTASGDLLADLTIPGGSEQAVDLDPSGTTVVSAGTDAVRQWDVDGSRRYMQRVPVRGLPWSAGESGGSCFTAPSSGGRFVAYLPCAFGRPDLQDSYVLLDVAHRRARLLPHAMSGWHFGGGSWRAGGPTYIRADGGNIRSFDGSSGTPVGGVHHPLGDHVSDVDHSPDGALLVAAEQPGRVTELDAGTFRARGRTVDVGEPVCCVSYGPDDHQAVVLAGGPELPAFWRTTVDRWALVDLDRGSVIRDGDLDFDGLWVASSPDGHHAVVTGSRGEVLVIDATTGRPVRPTVTAHAGGVFWAAFSPDGSRLVTSADDGTVVLWDTRTATQLARTAIAAPGLVSAEFLTDGRLLVVPWGGDAAVYLWDPAPERALAFACRAVGRDFTRTEWAAQFPGVAYRRVCPHP
jgi:WD40 repeat protein